MRIGRIIKLKPEHVTTYKKLHDELWPEVKRKLKDLGICNYTIFYGKGLLFSYYEISSKKNLNQIAQDWINDPSCAKWESVMKEMQEPMDDSNHNDWWVILDEVFHID